MNQVEEADHGSYLPSLQLSDKMPMNRWLGEGGYFRKRFLHTIFTQDGQAGTHTFRNMLDRHGLRRGHQSNHSGRTSGFFFRRPNFREHRLNTFRYRFRDERFHRPLARVAAAHSANRPYSSGRTSELAESDLSTPHRQPDGADHGAVDFPLPPIGEKEVFMANRTEVDGRDGLRSRPKGLRLLFDERFQIKMRFSASSRPYH